jgi:hypothetical protein
MRARSIGLFVMVEAMMVDALLAFKGLSLVDAVFGALLPPMLDAGYLSSKNWQCKDKNKSN